MKKFMVIVFLSLFLHWISFTPTTNLEEKKVFIFFCMEPHYLNKFAYSWTHLRIKREDKDLFMNGNIHLNWSTLYYYYYKHSIDLHAKDLINYEQVSWWSKLLQLFLNCLIRFSLFSSYDNVVYSTGCPKNFIQSM